MQDDGICESVTELPAEQWRWRTSSSWIVSESLTSKATHRVSFDSTTMSTLVVAVLRAQVADLRVRRVGVHPDRLLAPVIFVPPV